MLSTELTNSFSKGSAPLSMFAENKTRFHPPLPGPEWIDITENLSAALQEISADDLIYSGKNFQWARCVSAVELTLPKLDYGAGIPLGRTYIDSVSEGNVPDSIEELFFCPANEDPIPAVALTENLLVSTINWADGRRPLSEMILPSMHIYKVIFHDEYLGTATTTFLVETCLFIIKRIRSLLLATGIHFEEDICIKLQLPSKAARKFSLEHLVTKSPTPTDADAFSLLSALYKDAITELCRAREIHKLDDAVDERLYADLDCWWHLCAFLESTKEDLRSVATQARALNHSLSNRLAFSVNDPARDRMVGFDQAVVRYLLPASPPTRVPLMGLQETFTTILDWTNFCTRIEKTINSCSASLSTDGTLHLEKIVLGWLDLASMCAAVSSSLNPGILVRVMLCRTMLQWTKNLIMATETEATLHEETHSEAFIGHESHLKTVAEVLSPTIDLLMHVLCMNRGRQRRRLPRVIRKLARNVSAKQALQKAIDLGLVSDTRLVMDQQTALQIEMVDWARILLVFWSLIRILDLGFDLKLYSAAEYQYLEILELIVLRSFSRILELHKDASCAHPSALLLLARLALCESECVWNELIRRNESLAPGGLLIKNAGGEAAAARLGHENKYDRGFCGHFRPGSHQNSCEKGELTESTEAAFELRFRSVMDSVPISIEHIHHTLTELRMSNDRESLERGIAAVHSFYASMESEIMMTLREDGGSFCRVTPAIAR
ncbi:hypothetical protein F1559_004031 [Cyanidiococcus yangmingshanensis]|uniref:NAA35-like TPR repeats domain-containing protein n=1 Tax=Cyanidiococcus yangmingshanensis TaxID=2690220 RepID=A0A7J7IHG6_9RHOD|nr:hypothetical protein F1559_004031 [Cyanidiococcus yangmingshanensis]